MDGKRKGTTTLGLLCSDGIVFAADKRATVGYFIANREVEKIFQIDEKMAVTVAGLVADAQALVRLLRAEVKLYEMRNGERMTVNGACTLLSNIMHSYKFFPFLTQILIGGLDEKPSIYNIDPIGGITKEKFVSTGSGSPIAYGVLENSFKEDMPIKENLPLAVRALSIALKRDCGSGDGIDVVSISESGFKRYSEEEIKDFMKRNEE